MTTMLEQLQRDLFWKVRADPAPRRRRALAPRAHAFPYFVPVGSPLGREVVVGGEPQADVRLEQLPRAWPTTRASAEAAKQAVDRYGTGCTGSRLMNGTLDLHLELEAELADWMQREAALVFTAGYLANLATIATLCGPDDVIVTDAKNHASIEDGAQLSGAQVVRVRHNDLDQLEAKLGRLAQDGRATLVVWDSVFSMEGDLVDLPRLLEISRAAGRAHAHRRGALARAVRAGRWRDELGLDPGADLVMGTFSKSLASCGGVIAGDADVIEHLRIHARPFVFTASAVPAAVGAAQEAVRICRARAVAPRADHRARDRAWPTGSARSATTSRSVGARSSPSACRDEWQATLAWRALFEAGVYVNVGVYPAVPRGEALLRLSTTSTHEPADVDRCLETFAQVVP